MVTLDTTISVLASEYGLSRRTLNVCASAGILTIGDLLKMTDGKLLHLRNCGRHTQTQLSTLRDRYINLKPLSPVEQQPLPSPTPPPASKHKSTDPRQLSFDFDSEPESSLPESPALIMNLQNCYHHLFRQM
ncbi:MAG: DNA-directed RNA polymerase subunit alpha C-terminal domain-containing protein, partial [Muribaculaceae bacterium]